MGVTEEKHLVSMAQGPRMQITSIECPNCKQSNLRIDRFSDNEENLVCLYCGYRQKEEDK